MNCDYVNKVGRRVNVYDYTHIMSCKLGPSYKQTEEKIYIYILNKHRTTHVIDFILQPLRVWVGFGRGKGDRGLPIFEKEG